MRGPSIHGETVQCGDEAIRNMYPGIYIESLDGEEAAIFCCCRAALANHPCPRCLVHKSQLHEITQSFEPRTPENMQDVLRRAASASSKTAMESILKQYGLHNIQVCDCWCLSERVHHWHFDSAFPLALLFFGSVCCILLWRTSLRWLGQMGQAFVALDTGCTRFH